MFAEEMAEMASAAEPDGRSNPFNRQARSFEKAVCDVESDAGDKFHRREIECGPEFARESGPAHSSLLRQTGDGMGGSGKIQDRRDGPAEPGIAKHGRGSSSHSAHLEMSSQKHDQTRLHERARQGSGPFPRSRDFLEQGRKSRRDNRIVGEILDDRPRQALQRTI